MLFEVVGLIPRGRTARTAPPIAGIVGMVLSVVNQGDVIVDGHTTAGTWLLETVPGLMCVARSFVRVAGCGL